MTGAEALAGAVARLRAAGVGDAAGDARVLLAHALDQPRSRLTLVLPDPMTPEAAARYEAAITARAARQPVAQITGRRAFYGRDFAVTPAVLDPRPETELLVEVALSAPFESLLDLGTGSGCILLTLLAEREQSHGLGVDVSAEALEVAAANRARLGLEARADLARSDWFTALRPPAGGYDLIVSNPPYIAAGEMAGLAPEVREWEPAGALSPGGDGLAAYRIITAHAAAFLAPGGRLAVEIGPTQGAAVAAMVTAAGLCDVALHRDLDGRDRVVCGKNP